MLRSLIHKRLDVEEKALGVPLDYLRHVAEASLPAFFKFALMMPLARHRRRLPAAAAGVARLVAVRSEDCGSCVQIEVNLATHQGVPVETLRAVLDDRPADLPPALADVYHFARAVCEGRDAALLRARLRDRFGEEALVELSLGIAVARFFPVAKRALGYATSCALVNVHVGGEITTRTTALQPA